MESGTTITLYDAKQNGTYMCNQKAAGNLNGQTLTFDTAVTDAVIEYELAEEVIDPYTEEQQAVYDQIKEAYSYKGGTYISSPDEVKARIKVSGLKDLNVMFENLTNAIISQGANT